MKKHKNDEKSIMEEESEAKKIISKT